MDVKTGLYSKAAQIIRSLPQKKGSVEQLISAARKLGLREAELSHAGNLPQGPITREELAKIFETRLPRLNIDQYGENPSYLSREDYAAGPTVIREPVPEDDDYYEGDPMDTQYPDLTSWGVRNYRERLLRLGDKINPVKEMQNAIDRLKDEIQHKEEIHGADSSYVQQYRDLLAKKEMSLDQAKRLYGEPSEKVRYWSSHWGEHPNVLAHIRLSDRKIGPNSDFNEARRWLAPVLQKIADHMGVPPSDLGAGSAKYAVQNGLITPEEAATLSDLKDWQNEYTGKKGLDKRLLHVEELQSDWGQEGRDKGFSSKPYRVWDKKTGATLSEHDTHAQAWDAYRTHPDSDKLDYGANLIPPRAPYVTNTQHWTDLALKNVLREAALGNYDGIVFPSGQNQADRYSLEKHVDTLTYHPKLRRMVGYKSGNSVFERDNIGPEELPSYVGKEVADRLLDPQNAQDVGTDNQVHVLTGDDLRVGGTGMKGYYDDILPKSAMKLARQHDPSIQPGNPVTYSEGGNDYQGFHMPMTDKLRQGILNEGFPAFKRGGRVGFSQGGTPDDQNAGTYSATSAAPGAIPDAGGVRGSAGLLQAQDAVPLEGLPTSVRIPLTGATIKAGPDPRIRAVARAYMQQAGLPYNPPTKYAKVDPARAKRIAAAYEAMQHNPDDPLAKASYAAMVKETLAQYQAAKAAGFKAEFWNPRTQKDPYEASPRLAVEDVRRNHHMWVYPTLDGYGSGPDSMSEEEARRNPMLQLTGETWNGIPVTVNDVFRAVHDYYGHAKEGVGFRHDGEENAWRAHASMFSPLARLAMTTETRGQNSWLNFGPHGESNRNARTEDTIFAPQKMGVLPHWAHHEGAEDFMLPADVDAMLRERAKHDASVSKAMGITRRFTGGGAGAMMRPKP